MGVRVCIYIINIFSDISSKSWATSEKDAHKISSANGK